MFADHGIKLDEALTMIQKAVKSDPTSGAYWTVWVGHTTSSTGWISRRVPEESYHFYNTDASIHDHLGDLLLQDQAV